MIKNTKRKRSTGAILIEFALSFPILIFIFLAGHEIMQINRAYESLRVIEDSGLTLASSTNALQFGQTVWTPENGINPAGYSGHDTVHNEIQGLLQASGVNLNVSKVVLRRYRPTGAQPDTIQLQISALFNGSLYSGLDFNTEGYTIYLE